MMIRSNLTIKLNSAMINVSNANIIITASEVFMLITSVFHISKSLDIYVNEGYVPSILRPHTLPETEVVIFLDLFAVNKD